MMLSSANTTPLLSFVQELAANSDKNIQTDLIIMDFAKAFDKVPHQRLLYKLKFYGIKNQTLNWISAFLSNRMQTVVLDGFLETITIFLGFNSFVDDAVVGEHSEFAGFQIFW
jgi:hypothetical protein